MTDPDVVAFHERESWDPETGVEGILRDEWKLSTVESHSPETLDSALGSDWRRFFWEFEKSAPVIVLEHRYIRRGRTEPWKIASVHGSGESALRDIDRKAVAVNCPDLVWIQHERLRAAREHEAELARQREADQRAEEEKHQRTLATKAWNKFYYSAKWRPLCDEWNDLTTRPSAQALRDQLQSDTEFMRLYRLAIVESITAPAKRKAIRECLDYYNFMWLHREVEQAEEESES